MKSIEQSMKISNSLEIDDSSKVLCIFDVCGTLFNEDTTFGFIRYYLSNKPKLRIFQLVVLLIIRNSLIIKGFSFIEFIAGRHILKNFVVRSLKGEKIEDVQNSSFAYAAELLKNKRIDPVFRIYETLSDSYRIILASASIEPVISALSKKLNHPFVASCLEVSNHSYTGKILNDITGRKHIAIYEKFGPLIFKPDYEIVTDNPSDRVLVANSRRSVIVLRTKAQLKKWKGCKVEEIIVE
jgi:phosphoserine phosphatase